MSFFSQLFGPPPKPHDEMTVKVTLGQNSIEEIRQSIASADGHDASQCEIVVDKVVIEQDDKTGMLALIDAVASTDSRVRAFLGRVSISVTGYAGDTSALRQIPQIRDWFRKIYEERPWFLVFPSSPSNRQVIGLSIQEPTKAELAEAAPDIGKFLLARIATFVIFAGRDVRKFLKSHGINWLPVWDDFLQKCLYRPEQRQMILTMMDAADDYDNKGCIP